MSVSITNVERFWPLDHPALGGWVRAGVLRAGVGCYPRGWRIDRPHAERHLVVLCTGGSGRVAPGAGGRPLRDGMLWTAPAGVRQSMHAAGPWRLAWWYLDPAVWSVPRPGILACAGAGLLALAADELCRETRAPDRKPAAAPRQPPAPAVEDRAWLLAGLLLCEVRRAMAGAGADAADDPRLKRWRALLAAVRGEPGAAWSVASLAARTGVSTPTLRRLVRDQHGCAVRDLLVRERMTCARQLLRLTDLAHAEIAARVGYADAFAFARAFHRLEGSWPSEFRRMAVPDAGGLGGVEDDAAED